LLAFPGDKITPCIWEGVLTKKIAKKIERERKYTYDDYEKIFKPYNHINNLTNLKGKLIKIYLEKSDEIVPYHRGKKLVKKMNQMKLNFKIKETRLDHIAGTIKSVTFVSWLLK